MGNYLTNDELKTRFASEREVAFFTDDEDTGTASDSKLTDIVEAAEGMINSRLAKRYQTPVDTTLDTELAATLKRHTLDLAEGLLIGTRSERLSEAKQRQIDRVLDWSDKLALGEYMLPGAVTVGSRTTNDPKAAWTDHSRTLATGSVRASSRDSLKAL